jgi:hypothetical protein
MDNLTLPPSLGDKGLLPDAREKIAHKFEEWGKKRPDFAYPLMYAGAKGYTVAQIAKEIREGTEFGMDFVRNLPPDTLEELDAPPRPPLSTEQNRAIIRERMAQFGLQFDSLKPPPRD